MASELLGKLESLFAKRSNREAEVLISLLEPLPEWLHPSFLTFVIAAAWPYTAKELIARRLLRDPNG